MIPELTENEKKYEEIVSILEEIIKTQKECIESQNRIITLILERNFKNLKVIIEGIISSVLVK